MDVEGTIEFILTQQAKTEERAAKSEDRMARIESGLAKTERGLARTDRLLQRAIRAGVQEARAERRRRLELTAAFEEKMTQLSAAQLITEEKLQGLIEALRLGSNGHS